MFNIGNGEGITVNYLANLILNSMGREDLKHIYASPRPGYIRHSIADMTRAWKELRLKPKAGLEMGIKDLITHNVI